MSSAILYTTDYYRNENLKDTIDEEILHLLLYVVSQLFREIPAANYKQQDTYTRIGGRLGSRINNLPAGHLYSRQYFVNIGMLNNFCPCEMHIHFIRFCKTKNNSTSIKKRETYLLYRCYNHYVIEAKLEGSMK